MVTSVGNRRWPVDVSIGHEYAALGLTAPPLIRTEEIAVIETENAEWRGDIGATLLARVRAKLRHHLVL